jgi:hypothetical protein
VGRAFGFAGKGDLGHVAVAEQDVHDRVDFGRRIDDMAIAD